MKTKEVERKRASASRVTKRRDIRNRLGHLTVRQAERMMDPKGAEQLRNGARLKMDASTHLQLFGDTLIAKVPDPALPEGWARVVLVEQTSRNQGLQMSCNACSGKCIHMAATLATVLESKLALGLSMEPDPNEPIESLTESELIERAIADRKARAESERMRIESADRKQPWTEYTVTSFESGRSYHVSLRGESPGESSCTCPDFRTNQLGTCKHIFRVLDKVVKQFNPKRLAQRPRVRPTDEQSTMSNDHVANAARIAAKPFLTEVDLLRLQKHLLCARMAANSTFLVDKQPPGFSSKLEVLDELLEQLADEPTRKIVLFSEWTTMLSLIEPLLKKHGIEFVRLEGKVPQSRRQQIVHRFQKDPSCRAIIMSNAGATGLNLQAANTVINIDLPWNPAVLEQRIARAHRMGQKRPVHVFVLVTEDTIEERLLDTLAAKTELAHAALDFDSDISEVDMTSGTEALRNRLEILLGEKPTAPIDESERRQAEVAAQTTALRREKVAAAGGELLGAALHLVSQLLDSGNQPTPAVVDAMTTNLRSCVDRDEQGRPQLKLTLPDDQALQSLAKTLAQLLVTKDA